MEENKVLLSKPDSGWSEIKIRDFEAVASYLVDIPFEWLSICLYGLKNRVPISFFIDEEGSECFIISYYDVTHIVVDRDDEVECHTYRDIDFMDITKCLIEDIREYYDDWTCWSPYEDAEEEIAERKIRLNSLISEVENELNNEVRRCKKRFKSVI